MSRFENLRQLRTYNLPYLPENASPIVLPYYLTELPRVVLWRFSPMCVRIGFKAPRTDGLREGHGRHRVGLKGV
jgi:hypothetical protein